MARYKFIDRLTENQLCVCVCKHGQQQTIIELTSAQ